jgi:hypothetical protein
MLEVSPKGGKVQMKISCLAITILDLAEKTAATELEKLGEK